MPKTFSKEMVAQIDALQVAKLPQSLNASALQAAQPQGVQAIAPALLADLSLIQLIDPNAAAVLAQVGQSSAGVPRNQVKAPICRLPELSDAVLFDDPADPAKSYYLPRYRLATRSVSGAEQYAASLEQRAQGWALTLFLAKYAAPELGDAARSAAELKHTTAVLLRYRPLGASTTTRELIFQEVSAAGAELRAALLVGSLAERDELIAALSRVESQAQLVVRRAAQVALPVPAAGAALGGGELALQNVTASSSVALSRAIAGGQVSVVGTMARRPPIDDLEPPSRLGKRLPIDTPPIIVRPPVVVKPPRPSLAKPQITVRPEEEYEVGSKRWQRYTVSVTNTNAFPDELFAPAPDLPPCGNNTSAARTWVNIHASDGRYLYGFCALGKADDLRRLWFAVEAGQAPPPAVYVVLNDRRFNISAASDHVAVTPPPPIPRFRELLGVLDSVTQPFFFNRDDHSYIFRGAGAGSAPAGGLTPWTISWGDATFTYYQDAARPRLFFYLPDCLKLARRPEAPYKPFMSLRVTPPATQDGDATVTFTYVALPWVDAERLAAAAAELSRRAPQLAGAAPELQPLTTSAVRFVLERPKAVGSTSEERPLASANVLRSALCDTLTMSDRDFQPIFDALMGQGTALFHGKLIVDMGGLPAEEVPFHARLDDTAGGAMLGYAAAEAPGGLQVTLTNAIESPLRFDDLAATLSRGGGPQQPALIQGLSLPVARLEPGAQLSFTVTRESGVPGAGALAARFDTSRVRAIPDAEAVLDAILDQSQLEYYRTVTVVATAGQFAAPAGKPEEQIAEILVDFEEGDYVRLTAAALEGRARVNHPFADVILRRPITSTYTYRVTLLYADGRQKTGNPRQRNEELFFVEVER